MSKNVSRRTFAKVSALAGGAAIVGFDLRSRSWIVESRTQGRAWQGIPKLDGALLLDDATRSAVAVDQGKLFHRIPAAVLKPGSVQDVVKIVKFANQHGLKVATKGNGHSRYGQTQAEAGIVIDSRTLTAVQLQGTSIVDVQPGAFWSVVALVTLAQGVSPRVFPATCLSLTVGGVLNAGGIGNTSHRYGAIVDNVIELDVVTGDGRVVTCSNDHEAELFNMVLAGQGQCGIIVRGRFGLMPAPSHVVLQTLVYSDLDQYLADQQRVAREDRFDTQRGSMDRGSGGAWSCSIEVGAFFTQAETPDLGPRTSDLRFDRATAPARMTYREYLFRFEARNAAANVDRPSPYITMWMPASATRKYMADVLALSPPATGLLRVDGGETFSFYPMVTRRFTRPLFKVPSEEVAFSIWLSRSAPVGDQAALSSLLASNRELLAKMTAMGGKRYAPYSMVMTPAEWAVHFGPDVWKRFGAAKKKYDPMHVLSPEPAMFTVARR